VRLCRKFAPIHGQSWPSNIRELENILERSILFANGKEMTELDLELPAKTESVDKCKGVKEQTMARIEQSFLETALKQHQGDIKKVAESMGITSRAVYTKLKKYERMRPQFWRI
jgi:two-component system response regulator HydG